MMYEKSVYFENCVVKQVLLVTGGIEEGTGYLDSTEIYDPDHGSWRVGAALPGLLYAPSAANIDDRVLIFGISILLIKELFYV